MKGRWVRGRNRMALQVCGNRAFINSQKVHSQADKRVSLTSVRKRSRKACTFPTARSSLERNKKHVETSKVLTLLPHSVRNLAARCACFPQMPGDQSAAASPGRQYGRPGSRGTSMMASVYGVPGPNSRPNSRGGPSSVAY